MTKHNQRPNPSPVWAAAFITALALTACTPLPTQPARYDPYQGLLPAGVHPKESSVHPPVLAQGKSVALVVSNSTETQFQYLGEMLGTLKSNAVFGWRQDIETRGSPAYLVGQILRKFRGKFARAELVDNFNDAARGGFDYVALIDLGIRKPTSFGTEFAYDVDIDLLTPSVERIAHMAGRGLANNACPGVECMFATDQRALEQALAQLNSEFDRDVH